MSLAAGVGWLAAALAGGAWLLLQRGLSERMEAVARACHELRGPLTAARLGLELGSRGDSLSAAQLRAIELELGRATLALDDLARAPERPGLARAPGRPSMTRVAGRPSMSRAPGQPSITAGAPVVDLQGLTADSVEAWRPTARAAGVALVLRQEEEPVPATGDRLRLAQAVGNLIANAIEHGGEAVTVRALSRDGSARIEVADTGSGLPEPLEAIIRRPRRGRGQRGRGLAIVSSIAALHGGRLVDISGGEGTRLALVLPAAGGPGSGGDGPAERLDGGRGSPHA